GRVRYEVKQRGGAGNESDDEEPGPSGPSGSRRTVHPWKRPRSIAPRTCSGGRTKMPGRREVKAVVELEDEAIPAWQRQSVDRSLRSARARAHARSDRFVAAATRLLEEKASTDFTVQDVVERSKMSIRTFYKYFASKEDLLVAVSETVVAREAVPRLRE